VENFDRDGKSKTASAVDEAVITKKDHEPPAPPDLPGEAEIAARAHQIWMERGCPDGSAGQDWLDAERELKDGALSRRLTQMAHEKGGSVQN
jgi:hypothetical protein